MTDQELKNQEWICLKRDMIVKINNDSFLRKLIDVLTIFHNCNINERLLNNYATSVTINQFNDLINNITERIKTQGVINDNHIIQNMRNLTRQDYLLDCKSQFDVDSISLHEIPLFNQNLNILNGLSPNIKGYMIILFDIIIMNNNFD